MEKLKKDTGNFFHELAHMIDKAFEKIGAGFIPSIVRYIMIALIILSPILGICYLLIFDIDEEPPRRPTQRTAKTAASEGQKDEKEKVFKNMKREKIE